LGSDECRKMYTLRKGFCNLEHKVGLLEGVVGNDGGLAKDKVSGGGGESSRVSMTRRAEWLTRKSTRRDRHCLSQTQTEENTTVGEGG
jgi:hypothetical protein